MENNDSNQLQDKKVTTKIISSASNDPWYNLALEEYLLCSIKKNEVVLYLWQNKDTVVVGRNQNPWKECRCDEFEKDGGKLARRLSGGGAVFHDLGNLNFTFVMDKDLYDLNKQLNVILKSCKKIGINAEFTGRNDIVVEGKKFSGNAFYFGKNSAYHHGTILIDTNFKRLTKYLQVSKEKIVSKGIDSVSSRVVNLKSVKSSLTVEKMVEKLKETFIEMYSDGVNEEIIIGDKNDNVQKEIKKDMDKLYEKYSSWEWIYGKSPKFDVSFENRFVWGGIDIKLSLKDVHIQYAQIFSDAMNSDLIQNISEELKGIEFKQDAIVKTIKNIDQVSTQDKAIINDICLWLGNGCLQ